MHRKPSRSHPPQENTAIAQAAAAWVARRDRGLSAEEVQNFATWADADPRHQDAYADIAAAWQGLDSARLVPELDDQAEAVLRRAALRHHQRRWLLGSAALAAAAALVVLIVPHLGSNSLPESRTGRGMPQASYQVLASTARQQILPDGSVADLNGSSRIAVAYTATERRVHLLDGEVHFAVKKNPGLPFVVQVGHVAVQAVGTAFNVKLAPAGVEVLVTEGRVRVDDAEHGDSLLNPDTPVLQAGQKLIVGAPPAPESASPVQLFNLGNGDIDLELAWQSTRLVFNDTPLGDVVSAFNRYNEMQLRIGTSELHNRTLTGVFKAENLDGFLRLMQAGRVVTVHPGVPGTKILMPAR